MPPGIDDAVVAPKSRHKKRTLKVLFIGGPFDGLRRKDPRKPIERLRLWSLPKHLLPKKWIDQQIEVAYRRQDDGNYLYEQGL